MGGNAKRTQRYGGREMEEREWRKDLQGQRLGHSQTHAGGGGTNQWLFLSIHHSISHLIASQYRLQEQVYNYFTIDQTGCTRKHKYTHTHTEMVSHSLQCCSNHQISSFPFLTLGCLISIKLIYSDTVTWSSSHFNISYLPEAKARQLLRQPFCHPGSRVFGCIHTGHCCCNRAQTRPSKLENASACLSSISMPLSLLTFAFFMHKHAFENHKYNHFHDFMHFAA